MEFRSVVEGLMFYTLHSNRSRLQILLEKLQDTLPSQRGLLFNRWHKSDLLLASLKALKRLGQAIHKGVSHARIREDGALRTSRCLEIFFQLLGGRWVTKAGHGIFFAKVRLNGFANFLRLANARIGRTVKWRSAGNVVRVLRSNEGQRTAHAEPNAADFGAARFLEVLGGGTNFVLGRRPIEVLHEMMSFFGVDTQFAFVKVGNEAAVATLFGQVQGLSLDVLGHAPPFLQDDNGRRGFVATLEARNSFSKGYFFHIAVVS
mmetsp:Transcript_19362/g.45251  ORF Transcript_19362/g.45251 Transcript_19362/m.45251 type:complete len:262 (+) Transcript_19362:40-825(+)